MALKPEFYGVEDPAEADEWTVQIEKIFEVFKCTVKQQFQDKFIPDRYTEQKILEFETLIRDTLTVKEYEIKFTRVAAEPYAEEPEHVAVTTEEV
ncbi:hypothetical protein AAC387_Pa12g0584 [Persea americana]